MYSRATMSQKSDPIVYVHYGAPHFEPELFSPVKNTIYRTKPISHTGLWASRENDEYGWEPWCRRNDYRIEQLDSYFRFALPDANILTISEPDDLIPLPKLHLWEYTEPSTDEIPDFHLINNEYVPAWCYLDFEKLAEEYDAIELRNSQLFTYMLYGWDCNCLLVLKSEKMREL